MTIPAKMYNTGADYALSIIGGKWKPANSSSSWELPTKS